MKSHFLIFPLILAILYFETAHGQCPPPVENLILRSQASTCTNPLTVSSSQLRYLPTSGTRQFTFWTNFRPDSYCEKMTNASIINVMIGSSTSRKNLIEVIVLADRLHFALNVYDSTGNKKEPFVFGIDEDQFIRVGVSIDLANGLMEAFVASSTGFAYSTLTKFDFGTWQITSDQFFILLGTSDSKDNYGVTFGNTGLMYAYLSEEAFFSLMIKSTENNIIGKYDLRKTSTGYFEDTSGLYDSLGRLYLGQSTDLSSDTKSANIPTSAENETIFTETTQYLTLHSPLPFSTARDMSPPSYIAYSFTISFWIKILEQPTASQTILSRTTQEGASIFSLTLTATREIAATISGEVVATTENVLPLGEWTLVTVTYALQGTTQSNGQVMIYFGNILQTNAFFSPINTPGIFPEKTTDIVKIGGFKGMMRGFQVISPGGGIVNRPSCQTSCEFSLGFDYSQCLVSGCSDNMYYNGSSCEYCHSSCKTCSGPESTNCTSCALPKVLDQTTHMCYVPYNQVIEEVKGLSGLAIAGIVVGSILVAGIIVTIIYMICKKRMAKDDDDNPVIDGRELLMMRKK